MRNTQTYNGNDSKVTEALASYYFFQDDARFGGWQNYLTRSDDFHPFLLPHAPLGNALGTRVERAKHE